jgi:1-deoxy-D-xylulose-5-phosphate reductoisomerase
MRTPIAHSLAWPERIDAGVDVLDMLKAARLDFEPPDLQRFPCLRLAQEAWRAGGTASTVLNAANEVAVHAFLESRIHFTAIPEVIESTLAAVTLRDADSFDVILTEDILARACANEIIAARQRKRAKV